MRYVFISRKNTRPGTKNSNNLSAFYQQAMIRETFPARTDIKTYQGWRIRWSDPSLYAHAQNPPRRKQTQAAAKSDDRIKVYVPTYGRQWSICAKTLRFDTLSQKIIRKPSLSHRWQRNIWNSASKKKAENTIARKPSLPSGRDGFFHSFSGHKSG